MTATKKPLPDAAKVYVAATVIALLGKHPMETLSRNQLEDLESSAETVLMAAMSQVVIRDEAVKPRSAGHLRLAAAYGELTPAGQRSLRARRAARVRWSR